GTLCLEVVASVNGRDTSRSCAPLSALNRAGAPALPVIVDQGFGRSAKTRWFGIDRIGAPAVQVTAGLAADGVTGLGLRDQAGPPAGRAVGNSFLYVSWNPDVGQRVSRISARTGTRTVDVPFAPTPFDLNAGQNAGAPTGPTGVDRPVRSGSIGWLVRRELRG